MVIQDRFYPGNTGQGSPHISAFAHPGLFCRSLSRGQGGLDAVVFVVLIFASVVFHELSHSIVARHYGIRVLDITLLPIGGVARMPNPPDSPLQEVIISAAGPLASLVLAFLLWFSGWFLGYSVSLSDLSAQGNLLSQLAAVNLVLAMFNLIPAFPDGWRTHSPRTPRIVPQSVFSHTHCRRSGNVSLTLCCFWDDEDP